MANYFPQAITPVETLLPMLHIHHAGFELEVATLSGNPAKLEIWAMPKQDNAIMDLYQQYLPKFIHPKKLADILPEVLSEDSPYPAVFIPRGHGVLAGIPHNKEVKTVLD